RQPRGATDKRSHQDHDRVRRLWGAGGASRVQAAEIARSSARNSHRHGEGRKGGIRSGASAAALRCGVIARCATVRMEGDMPREQRRWRRKPIGATGFLYTSDGRQIGPCEVRDVSEGGAMLVMSAADELPVEFVLSLSRNGQVRRHCQ